MSKIVKLSAHYKSTAEYRMAIAETIGKMHLLEEEIHGMIVNLAVNGKWKEWSDSIPVGSEFTFTEAMLKDTGDKNVDALAALLDEVRRVRKLVNYRR